MRRARVAVLVVVLSLGALSSCVGGDAPTGPELTQPTAAVALVPVFPADALPSASAPVNLIRITVTTVPGGVQVLQIVQTVDPDATQWTLGVEVPLTSDPATEYLIEVELLNEVAGYRTVQWSGRAGPLRLRAGITSGMRPVSVGRGPLDNLAVSAVRVQGPSTVREAEPFDLDAEVQVSRPGARPVVFWTSLTPDIATLDEFGHGLALREGTARVEASSGPITVVHEITVSAVPTTVSLTPVGVTLTALGQVAQLSAAVLCRCGSPIPGAALTWKVDDPRVLEPLGQGRFRALAGGATKVTAASAEDPDVTASGVVTVAVAPVELRVEPEAVVFSTLGQTADLSAVGRTADGTPVYGMEIGWTSSNRDVATVDATGRVTAVLKGEAVITAVANLPAGATPLTATARVTVWPGAARVELTPASVTLTYTGEERVFHVAAFDAAGGPLVEPGVSWSSSASTVATVDPGGVVRAASDGTAKITARVGDAAASSTVTVDIAVTSVVVQPSSPTLEAGGHVTLSASAFDAFGSEVPVSFAWTTSDAGVASVSSAGLVTGVEPGEATITATAKGVSGSARVLVTGSGGPEPVHYTTAGNTQLVVGDYPMPATPAAYDATPVLSPLANLTALNAGVLETAQEGDGWLEPDGSFTYMPPVGFVGDDSFVVETGLGPIEVTITVAERVWWVSRDGDPYGDGRSDNPFDELWGPELASSEGDIIFLFASETRFMDGIELKRGQTLVGEAAGLTLPGAGVLVAPGGGRPILDNGDGESLILGRAAPGDNTVRGIEVWASGGGAVVANDLGATVFDDVRIIAGGSTAVRLQGSSGSLTFTNGEVQSGASLTFWISGGDPVVSYQGSMTSNGGMLLAVEYTTGGSATFTGGPHNAIGGEGVLIQYATGDVHIEELDVGSMPSRGIVVIESTGSYDFVDVNIDGTTAGAFIVDGGAPTITVDVEEGIYNLGGPLVAVSGADGSVQFTGADLRDQGGEGIRITSGAAAVSIDNRVQIIDPDPYAAAAALYLFQSNGGVRLADLEIQTAGLRGIVHDTGAGILEVDAGTIVTAESAALQVRSAPVAIQLTSLEASSWGTDGLVSIWDSPTSDVGIGTLTLSSPGAGFPLDLIHAGTFSVSTGSIVVVDGRAAAATGTALDVRLASLNASSADGPAIDLRQSGGVFSVAGGSLDLTGPGGAVLLDQNSPMEFAFLGSIANVDGYAIMATGNTGAGDTWTFGSVVDQGDGILLSGNHAITFACPDGVNVSTTDTPALQLYGGGNLRVTGFENVLASGSNTAVILQDLDDGLTVLNDVYASGGYPPNLHVTQTTGRASVQVVGGSWGGGPGTGIMVNTTGTAVLGLSLDGVNVSGAVNDAGLGTYSDQSSELHLVVAGGSTFVGDAWGIRLHNEDAAAVRFDIDGNQVLDAVYEGVRIESSSTAGSMDGFVRNNTITGSGGNAAVQVEGVDAGPVTVQVSGNSLTTALEGYQGVHVMAGTEPGSTADVHVKIRDNTVDVDDADTGVLVAAYREALICADIADNVFTDVGTGEAGAMYVTQMDAAAFQLERLIGTVTPAQTALVAARLTTDNPVIDGLMVDAYVNTLMTGVPAGACRAPTQ